jgi:hypothetical protein
MRRILALTIVAIVATAVFGAAATLGVSARPLGAGSDVVGDCHTGNPPAVVYTYTDNKVVSLTVSGLATTCNGGSLKATVTKADGTSPVQGTAAATVTNQSATVTFPSPGVPGQDVGTYHLVIVKAAP